MLYRAIASCGKLALVWSVASIPWLCSWWYFSCLAGWPLNDDPFYAKPLETYSQTGEWQLVKQNGELTASSVGHLALGFVAAAWSEFSYRRLYLACIAQQALGVAALYLTSRTLSNSVLTSVLAAASLASFPLFFGHAFTFMTDGPAASWASVALCCGTVGVVHLDWRWLLAASIALGWGFWIRQTNGLLFLAPAVAWLLAARSTKIGRWHFWLGLAAISLPFCFAIILLESGLLIESSVSRLADVSPAIDGQYFKNVTIAAYGAILLFGWFSLPWLLFAIRCSFLHAGKLGRRARVLCASAASLVFLVSLIPFASTAGRASITNATGAFIQNAHFGPIFLSDMDEPGRWSQLGGVEWPLFVWQVLTVASIASGAAIAWWLAWSVCIGSRSLRENSAVNYLPHVQVAIGISVAILCSAAVLIFLIEPHMDRYWLFTLAGMAVWTVVISSLNRVHVVHSSRDRNWNLACFAWAIVFILFNFCMSTVFTHDMLAWNNARWGFVNEMLDAGMQPEEIDGGRDVNAWLRLDEDPNSMPRQGDSSKWWSGSAKLAISVGERPGWQEVKRLPWSSWATGRAHFLLVLSKTEDQSVEH